MTEARHRIEVSLARGGERLSACKAFTEQEMQRVEEAR